MAFSQRVYPVPHDWRPTTLDHRCWDAFIAAATLGETVSVQENFLIKSPAFAAVGLCIIAGLLDRADFVDLARSLRGAQQTLRRLRRQAVRPVQPRSDDKHDFRHPDQTRFVAGGRLPIWVGGVAERSFGAADRSA